MKTEKKYQLPKEFAEKWVAALRSGKYKQGKSRLRSPKGEYCCLGVACIVQKVPYRDLKDALWITGDDYYGFGFIPEGFPSQLIGKATENELVRSFASLNDSQKSFPEIADWIEENCQFI